MGVNTIVTHKCSAEIGKKLPKAEALRLVAKIYLKNCEILTILFYIQMIMCMIEKKKTHLVRYWKILLDKNCERDS